MTRAPRPGRRSFSTSWAFPLPSFPRSCPRARCWGNCSPTWPTELGIAPIQVIAPACHDTGSAVAAVPAQGNDYAYISSGTWSLMGIEVDEPVITAQSLTYNFTNEGGVCDTFRVLKNIMGLWLVQECRREWARAGESYDYGTSDPDGCGGASLLARSWTWTTIASWRRATCRSGFAGYCRETGQPVPESKGEILRCALEGLALRYRWCLEKLEEMVGHRSRWCTSLAEGCRTSSCASLPPTRCSGPWSPGPLRRQRWATS